MINKLQKGIPEVQLFGDGRDFPIIDHNPKFRWYNGWSGICRGRAEKIAEKEVVDFISNRCGTIIPDRAALDHCPGDALSLAMH